MNDDELGAELRRQLRRHRETGAPDLADAAIARAGQRRRNQQALAGALALVAVAGAGGMALHLHQGQQDSAETGALSTITATPHEVASSPTTPPTCTETTAQWSIAKAPGASSNGVQTYRITVRPMRTECTIGGVPGFWLEDANNQVLGAPARHDGATGAPVVVTENQAAVATVRYDSKLATGTSCKPASGSIRFFAPGGTIPMGSATKLTGCRNATVQLFTVSTFVAG